DRGGRSVQWSVARRSFLLAMSCAAWGCHTPPAIPALSAPPESHNCVEAVTARARARFPAREYLEEPRPHVHAPSRECVVDETPLDYEALPLLADVPFSPDDHELEPVVFAGGTAFVQTAPIEDPTARP